MLRARPRVPRKDVRPRLWRSRGSRDRVGRRGVRRPARGAWWAPRRRACHFDRAGLRDGAPERDRARSHDRGGQARLGFGRRRRRHRHRGNDRGIMEIVRIKRLELAFAPRPWPFAQERREEIVRYFDELRAVKPAVWNGRILLLYDHAVVGDVFRGAYFETDYASFLAWRNWGCPDATIRNCFSLGALRGSDGGFLLGVMNSHTVNAGKI